MSDAAPPDAPTLAVVLVTYESAAVIGSCLAALAGIGDLEVVIVDNASTDGTVALAREAGAQVVALDGNRGFAAAANAGAQQACAGHLCFLNPDCLLTPAAVAAARLAWRTAPTAALVPDFAQQGTTVRGRQPGYSRAKLLVDLLETRRALPAVCARLRVRRGYHDTRWHWPLGTCLFVPRRTFEAVGGFDESYFLYMEDCAFGQALHAHGFGVVSLPVTVAHLGCGSSALALDARWRLLETARLRWARRHYGLGTAWALRAVLGIARLRAGSTA